MADRPDNVIPLAVVVDNDDQNDDYADTDAEVELPLRSEVYVDGGKELLLLVFYRVETGNRSTRSVIFESAGNFLGEIVADLHVG